MFGLWDPTTTYGRDFHRSHFAIAISLPELIAAGPRLETLESRARISMAGEPPNLLVIGWMPSAQIYFRDPDGHSLEYITLLDGPPEPDFIGPLSEWREKIRAERSS